MCRLLLLFRIRSDEVLCT
ncbi:hypothetical protein F383_31154 [Gossypium arboreum]|uniref:Uncharacterized protein n=1 Tax=Gossypium arboreum TaxID=29729 RepID=A0A0B0PL48_GOSAR|nr:hypothetical protein F383_31154 [Gossypium arboreum]